MKRLAKSLLAYVGLELRRFDIDRRKDNNRLFEKYRTFSMVPHIEFAANLDLVRNYTAVEGDYVECGVWRGGMSAAIAEVLGNEREIHLFDSFQGLPVAQEIDGKDALDWQGNVDAPGYFDNCTAEVRYVEEAMALAGHKNFKVYQGWFSDTLPTFPATKIAILRLDGDWYESIMTSLTYLYPMVVTGGLIILDDYSQWDGCSRAVHKYLSDVNSPCRIEKSPGTISYLVKR